MGTAHPGTSAGGKGKGASRDHDDRDDAAGPLTPRSHPRLIALLIVVATFAALGRIVSHDFTRWDDVYNISTNPRLNPPTLESIAWYWRNQQHGLYIPLTYSAWGVLARLSYLDQPDDSGIHLNPYVFHLASLVVHACGALLVFAILQMLLRDANDSRAPRSHGRQSVVLIDLSAGIGALLFALHPVQVESVAWAAGFKDVLCGCLSLLSIWLYLLATRSLAEHPRDRTRQLGLYIGATIALVAAMLAKPVAMVVPAIVLVLDVWVMRRRFSDVVVPLLPWFALSIACAIIAKWAQPAHGVPGIELWKRPFLAGDALAFYVYKLIVPARLGLDYGWRPVVIAQQWWFWVLWIIPSTLFVVLFIFRKRVPELWAAALVFVIGVAPVLGFSRFLFQYYSTVADHYLYLAMLGPALAAAWVVSRLFNRMVLAICAIVLIALGVRTFRQAGHWKNDLTLFQHAIHVNPDSFLFTRNLGYVYKTRGQYDLAEPLLRRAIEIKPDHWEAHLDLAEILFVKGQIDEAIEHVETAIEIKRAIPPEAGVDYVQNQVTLADTLMSLGRFERAAHHYQQAIEAKKLDVGLRQKLEEARRLAREAATRPATSPAAATTPR